MTKKHSLSKSRTIEVLPPTKALDAERLVPRESFELLPFWSDLAEIEQTKLMAESYQLITARKEFGLAIVSMGQHLLFIQNMLAGRPKAFGQYLKAFKFSGRSGYRYIQDYQRLMKLVKVPVLQVMLTQGFKIDKATRARPLGEFTEAHVALEMNGEVPPTTMDVDAALRYVKKLTTQREKLLEDPRSLAIVKRRVEQKVGPVEKRDSYEALLFHSYHLVRNAIKRTPVDRQEEFVDNLVGYILTSRNLQERHFTAQTVPSELRRRPGRPSKEESTESTFSTLSDVHDGADMLNLTQ